MIDKTSHQNAYRMVDSASENLIGCAYREQALRDQSGFPRSERTEHANNMNGSSSINSNENRTEKKLVIL